jgi:hypothetical protein
MYDKRTAPAACAQVLDEQLLDGGRLVPPHERNGKQPRWLVDDDHPVVLVHDGQCAARRAVARTAAAAAGPIHPDLNAIARRQPAPSVSGRRFLVVHEDLSTFERRHGTAAGAEPRGSREELVEPKAGLFAADGPHGPRHAPVA